jgi:hypothetical protein
VTSVGDHRLRATVAEALYRAAETRIGGNPVGYPDVYQSGVRYPWPLPARAYADRKDLPMWVQVLLLVGVAVVFVVRVTVSLVRRSHR